MKHVDEYHCCNSINGVSSTLTGRLLPPAITMGSPLLPLNYTQADAAQLNLDNFVNTSVIPSFLLESYLLGVLSSTTLLGLCMIWSLKEYRRSAKFYTIGVLVLYGGFTTHWALSLQQIGLLLSDSAINILELSSQSKVASPYSVLGVGLSALASIAETVFFGISSTLFLAAFCIVLRSRKLGMGTFTVRNAVIPFCSGLMFIISVAHWSIEVFLLHENFCAGYYHNPDCSSIDALNPINILVLSNLSLLSFNIVLSDIIVLWRVYATWDRKRWVLIVCSISIVCTITFTIAFLTSAKITSPSELDADTSSGSPFTSFGLLGLNGNISGLVSQASSLVFNILATALIALKSWRHRRDIVISPSVTIRRTMVERVLALLIESGMVYTFIWVLYIASDVVNLLNVTVPDTLKAFNQVTSVKSVAGSAMVHITAIYPTMLIIFIAFRRIQYEEQFVDDSPTTIAQAPRVVSHSVTVSIGVDIERSAGTVLNIERDLTSISDDDDAAYVWSPKLE